MDFTREPIIETIITPKDGHKLVVRSTKVSGQEEFFVDAVEVVSFGRSTFFRSLERPKAFLVPVSDYEVFEVREARMVLKNVPLDRSIKINGSREKASRESEKADIVSSEEEKEAASLLPSETQEAISTEGRPEMRLDKKRDRKKHYRKRRGREEQKREEGSAIPNLEDEKIAIPQPREEGAGEVLTPEAAATAASLSSLLTPPPMLISETINRYRENASFRSAFFLTEEEQYKPHEKAKELLNEEDEGLAPTLLEPTFEPLEESSEETTNLAVEQEEVQPSESQVESLEKEETRSSQSETKPRRRHNLKHKIILPEPPPLPEIPESSEVDVEEASNHVAPSETQS